MDMEGRGYPERGFRRSPENLYRDGRERGNILVTYCIENPLLDGMPHTAASEDA